MVEQLDSYSRCPARESVHDQQELRSRDVRRSGVTLADAMFKNQAPIELGQIAGLDTRSLAHADTGR
jgi:hypothetical protein